MTSTYDLVLGMQHTNRSGLAEHLLLAQAGHMHWASLARAIGVPLSTLRTLQGGEIYATFYFIDVQFPREQPISSFKVDDRLTFSVALRAFKNIAVEANIVFDRAECSAASTPHPALRLASIFITPEQGDGALKVAPPATGDFSRLPPLPNDENPYQLSRNAEATGELGLLGEGWQQTPGTIDVEHEIDPERDTNGAGLVYFANYVAFMNAAERQAWASRAPQSAGAAPERSLLSRRIAYYGNVDVDDAVRTRVSLYRRDDDAQVIGAKYLVTRRRDGRVICRSEAVKLVTEASA